MRAQAWRRNLGSVLPWLPLALGTVVLARAVIVAVLGKLGHPGAALDDAYIHFQYARAIAEGHPLRYQAGEPISTGATSFLWPAMLAPFWALGVRGEGMMWPAWVLSFAAHGALAREVYLLTRPLADKPAAIGAAAMSLVFGGLVWGAASGMEVAPFAFLAAFALRKAAAWIEAAPPARSGPALAGLFATACALPLLRPEGALFALLLGAAVAYAPRDGGLLRRLEAAPLLAAAALPNLLLLVVTGHPTTSTTQVKLLVGNPYYVLADAAIANARTLLTSILDGGPWSAEFLPKGGAPFAAMGLVAVLVRGAATKRLPRAALVLVGALAMFVPCVYVTFLWNRLRYLWPFIPCWFVGLACLARLASGYVARLDRRAGVATTTLLAGVVVGALVSKLDWVVEDVAQSASGIDRQQVALGHWVAKNLPASARVGLNDTGAIAYFGDRKTFDVVGLTTPTEGRYWVAGAASRLEHYERLRKDAPAALPTHFVVYPEWMACPPVLGDKLHEAVVRDSTILGGQSMEVHLARFDHLGSGELPWTAGVHEVVDSLDVADLESEAEHRYALLGAREGEQVAEEGPSPSGAVVVDGGRTQRHTDRFVAKLPPGKAARGILRVAADADAVLLVRAGGRDVGTVSVPAGPWTEVTFEVPADVAAAATEITVTARGGRFTSFHYWFSPAAP